MTVLTLAEAKNEFVQSVDYYELKEPGLGYRFDAKWNGWSTGSRQTRRCHAFARAVTAGSICQVLRIT